MQEHPEPDPTEGLVKKYDVTRVDGDPTGKHAKCDLFVLDPQHDKRARTALLSYAEEAARDGQDQLAVDIINWIGRLELEDQHPQLARGLRAEIEEEARARAVCSVHRQTDCSPLLNGCSELTKQSEPARQDFPMEGVENKGGQSFPPTFDQDGKRI